MKQTNKITFLFIFATVFFVGVRLYFHTSSILQRDIPIEPDDSYGYILEAYQMKECFLQDCPALDSLREQLLLPSEDDYTATYRSREYFRVFTIHHPLYSLIFLALDNFTPRPETTYNILELVGSIFLSFAIAIWIKSVWGEVAAACTLIVFSFSTYHGHGISAIVPSTLALGIGMFLWAYILNRLQKTNYRILILSILLLLSMHPNGLFYSTIALFLWALLKYEDKAQTLDKFFLFQFIGLATPISLYVLLMKFVHTPEFNWDILYFYDNQVPTIVYFLKGIINGLKAINIFQSSNLELITIAIFVISGILYTKDITRKKIAFMGVLLTGAYFGAFVLITPKFEGFIPFRLFVPLSIFWIGAIFYGASNFLPTLYNNIQSNIKNNLSINSFFDFRNLGLFLLSILFAGLIILTAHDNLHFNGTHYRLTIQHQIDNKKFSLKDSQDDVQELFTLLDAGDSVVYRDEISLYYGLIHGGNQYGAIFLPAVVNTPLETEWITNNTSLKYIVALSPFREFNNGAANLALQKKGKIKIYTNGAGIPDTLEVFVINNYDKILDIQLRYANEFGNQQENIPIPPNYQDWMIITLDDSTPIKEVTLITLSGQRDIIISGIRFDEMQTTNWPWDQGYTLSYFPTKHDEEPIVISLDFDQFISSKDLVFDIFDDRNSILILRIQE